MNNQILVRHDPDFNPRSSRTIDLRGFFPWDDADEKIPDGIKNGTADDAEDVCLNSHDMEEIENILEGKDNKAVQPIIPDLFVASPAIRAEKKRKEKIEREKAEKRENITIRRRLVGIFLYLIKRWLFSMLELYQVMEERYKAQEWGGAGDFTTKYTDETLYLIAMALPQSLKTADDLLTVFPFMSRPHRYRLLSYRRDKVKMYRRIFKKQ